VPIVSGNVSLYNDTDGRSVLPTPTIAGVGLIASPDDIVTSHFKRAGDTVWLLGEPSCTGDRALGGSEWLVRKSGGKVVGFGPTVDLAVEAKLQKLVLQLARAHVLSSAHDVSDGGLATTLAECAAAGPEDVGASITLPASASELDAVALLFGEAPSLVVVSAPDASTSALEAAAGKAGVKAVRLGQTGGASLSIAAAPRAAFQVAVAELRARRDACLEGIVGK
jgi:phosphoribosylformylglycinamidine synthase